MYDDNDDFEIDAREEREEELLLEDHEDGKCDPESCFWCKEEEVDGSDLLVHQLRAEDPDFWAAQRMERS